MFLLVLVSVLGDLIYPSRLLEHQFGYRVVITFNAGGRMLRNHSSVIRAPVA